jgi:hypothetical protein
MKRLHTSESDTAHDSATRNAVTGIASIIQQNKHTYRATGIIKLEIQDAQSVNADKAKKETTE